MNATHLIVFNRSAAPSADGWIHIVPRGELPNREAGIVQVLDDTSLDSILRNLQADQSRANWPGLYGGREHFIYNDDQDSAALAWFKEFERRNDGIWGKAELTDIGTAAIKNGQYKWTSFVADRRDTQKVEGNKVRILKIDTIGFTNQPNGRELLTPITNRKALSTGLSPADAENQKQKGKMKAIAQRLKLSADASEDAVLAEVEKLLNRADISPADLTKLRDENTLLTNTNKELLTNRVESDLEAYKDCFEVKDKDAVKQDLITNRELTVRGFERVRAKGGTQPGKPGAVILNRSNGNPPGKETQQETVDAKEQAKANLIKNRAGELQKANPKRGFNDCWRQAESEAAATAN